MINVKRYDIEAACSVIPMNGEMVEWPDGDWVLFADYEKITQRVQELEKEVVDMMVDYIYPRS